MGGSRLGSGPWLATSASSCAGPDKKGTNPELGKSLQGPLAPRRSRGPGPNVPGAGRAGDRGGVAGEGGRGPSVTRTSSSTVRGAAPEPPKWGGAACLPACRARWARAGPLAASGSRPGPASLGGVRARSGRKS